jgi:hypothetical protein
VDSLWMLATVGTKRARTAVSEDNQSINRGGQHQAMELLPSELRARLPPLYSQESVSDPIVHIKFFTPDSNWTWYVTEGSPEGEDFIFFGYVIGLEKEWGYFALSELASARGPLGLAVERDLYFQAKPFGQIQFQ